ncbi:hypothetical protein EDE15_1053 [Edaphobacter aggregans]|uniref:Uncharacterized protein n=1 Tax=Edaphobacter aggregans TaxID=570835 RepID=A0A428MFE1_9BACT|nr:hypothetical protein [Edaphobacter aggregans]RSL15562.1 hypothetical protein EDE15_1053 [Edaphobacter aggregans]
MKASKTSASSSFTNNHVFSEAVSHNLHLTAFVGIRLHETTEFLYKLKMETDGKPFSKRNANRINQLEVEIKKYKRQLEEAMAATKLMEVAA